MEHPTTPGGENGPVFAFFFIFGRCQAPDSGELTGGDAFLAGFVQQRVDLSLQVFLFRLQRANLRLDGFAVIAFVELDAARGSGGFACTEVLQIHELLVEVSDLPLQFFELLANRCDVLRVHGFGSCRCRVVFWVAHNGGSAIRAGEVFVGPDLFRFLRLGRSCGILGWGRWRRGAAVGRLRCSGISREKNQDHCEGDRTGHEASSLSTSRTLPFLTHSRRKSFTDRRGLRGACPTRHARVPGEWRGKPSQAGRCKGDRGGRGAREWEKTEKTSPRPNRAAQSARATTRAGSL